MKTARVYLPKRKLCESSGSYVKSAKNLFRSPATKKSGYAFRRNLIFILFEDGNRTRSNSEQSGGLFVRRGNERKRDDLFLIDAGKSYSAVHFDKLECTDVTLLNSGEKLLYFFRSHYYYHRNFFIAFVAYFIKSINNKP